MAKIGNRIKKKIWECFEANSEYSLDIDGYVSEPKYNLISEIKM